MNYTKNCKIAKSVKIVIEWIARKEAMRILTVSYEFPPIGGGGSSVVVGLAKELVNLGHEVDLVTMSFKGLARRECVHGINVYRVPCIRLRADICRPGEMVTYLMMAFPMLYRLVHRNHYDLNHTHFIFPDALLSYWLKKMTGLPYIVTAHGSDVPGYNPNRFMALHRILKPVWKHVVGSASEIVSPSHALVELIEQQKSGTPITVIPNGFSVDRFQPARHSRYQVLIVSRMFERKGIQYFLRALDGLPYPLKVDIIGDGNYLEPLKELAGEIKTEATITFHGWLDNLSPQFGQLVENASIFVYPSEAENFPIALLEAMAAGLAIITTSGTGCAEVVGETGLLVPPRDPDAIRKALQRLVDHPELVEQLGQAARQRVEKEFGWPAVARRYLAVYQRVMEMSRL